MKDKIYVNVYLNYAILSLIVSYSLYLTVIKNWVLAYEIFIDLLLLLFLQIFLILSILTAIDAIKNKKTPSKYSIFILVTTLALYAFTYGNRNGMFWGKQVLNAAFIDDRSRIDLELYQNGKYLLYSNWLFGEERFEGKYKFKGDSIVFENQPLKDNDFISKKIIIDRNEGKIYFRKRDDNYDKSFYYFQIDF